MVIGEFDYIATVTSFNITPLSFVSKILFN